MNIQGIQKMVGAASPGDQIEVKAKGRSYVGQLMPRPKLAEPGYLTLKLPSGYNIGIRGEDVESVNLLKKAGKGIKAATADIVFDGSKPTVSILATGGTIASKVDYQTGGVYASFSASDLLDGMPELSDLANIRAESIMNVMSEDMNPKLWVDMAEAVAGQLNSGAEGVVVTHGTDTMHYSTAALSFMLSNLGKPVVFTGAQRSTDRGSADSYLNLMCSVSFAKSDVAGVYLVMHGSMSDSYCHAHIGTKVRKMHTTRRDAFKSINATPVANIRSDGDVTFLSHDVRRRSEGEVVVDGKLEDRVALVKVYPGVDPGLLDYYLGKGVKGIVLEGTALGHVPTTIKETSLIPKIEALVDAGVLVAMTTQCLYGVVNPHVYSNLREVSSRGVLYCGDMLPETAYVKLMWALGKSGDVEGAKKLMLKNVAGEFTKAIPPSDDFIGV